MKGDFSIASNFYWILLFSNLLVYGLYNQSFIRQALFAFTTKSNRNFLFLKKSFFGSVSVQILYFRGSDDCVPHIVRHTTA